MKNIIIFVITQAATTENNMTREMSLSDSELGVTILCNKSVNTK